MLDPHRSARPHYAWVILAVTGLTVVMTAGVTAVPAVLIHPLEVAFGWDRAAIALAVSINVSLYGLAGPFAGRVMLRVGLRRVMLNSLLLIAGGVAASTQVQTLLHLYLLWGVVVGVGTGSTALVLSATVVNRWFTTQRGLALGLLGTTRSPFYSVMLLTFLAIGLYGFIGPFWALPNEFLTGFSAAAGIALINSVGNLSQLVGPCMIGAIAMRTESLCRSGARWVALFLSATLVLLLPKKARALAKG